MFFHLLIISTKSAVFGIDFGDCYTKVSTASGKHLVQFAMNSLSKYLNPTIISIWNQKSPKLPYKYDENHPNLFKWGISDIVRSRCIRYPETCIRGIPIMQNTTFAGNDTDTFTGIYLKTLIDSVKVAEDLNESINVVLSIPTELTAQEKLLLSKSSSMINHRINKFVKHTSSVAYLYAIERSNTFTDKDAVIGFLDIGSKGSRFSVYKFSKFNGTINIQEIGSAANERAGGNLIDDNLYNMITKANSISITKMKHKYSLMEEIKKSKEMLTLHESVNFKYENPEDNSIKNITITRDDLLKASDSLKKEIIKICQKFEKISVDKIEFIGGGTRLFFLPDIVKDIFGIDKISHTLNADAAVSMGATYFAASVSNEFTIPNIKFDEFVNEDYQVKIGSKSFNIFGENSTNNDIFHIRVKLPKDKTISIAEKNFVFCKFNVDAPDSNTIIDISFVMGNYLLPVPYAAYSYNKTGHVIFHKINIIPEKVNSARYNSLIKYNIIRKMREKAHNDLEVQLINVKNFISAHNNTIVNQVYQHVNKWLETVTFETKVSSFNEALQYLNNMTL